MQQQQQKNLAATTFSGEKQQGWLPFRNGIQTINLKS